MTRMSFPDAYRFGFELELEISSVLTFSAGELCALVVDALFTIDEQGKLFPGVTTPDSANRLKSVKMRSIGYARIGSALPVEERYRRLILRKGRVSKTSRTLGGRLEAAAATMMTNMLHQRMLTAKLIGLADKCREPSAVTDADRTIAETLLAAATAVAGIVDASVRPTL